MLGTRGVRLGVVKPGLYAMQVRALVEAALDRAKAGGKPVVEIMIPLTVTREEMAEARGWVTEAIAEACRAAPQARHHHRHHDRDPQAAVRADEIAEVADFFSFGTNDLTQMAFGFSRDDVESRVMPVYLEHGLLRRNPFETIDVDGVGDLVAVAVERGRRTNRPPQARRVRRARRRPASIAFFQRVGLDYVSCSPFRVPVARLAAAQAIVAAAEPRFGTPAVPTPRAGQVDSIGPKGSSPQRDPSSVRPAGGQSLPSARWVRPLWRARPSAGSPVRHSRR